MSHTVKYFGIHINKQLKFTKQANHSANKVKAAKSLLYLVINAKSTLSIYMKLQIHKIYIRPILTYAATIQTANILDTRWATFEKVQSTTLRTTTEAKTFVKNFALKYSTKIFSIKGIIQRDTTNIATKLKYSPHEHLADISTNLK